MPEEQRPVSQAEQLEFNQRRVSSGLDGKEGVNVFVISGSAISPGAGGVSGETVIAKVSGETVIAKVSGETVIAKVSGETVVAKVSGETVVAKISGETVVAKVSGETVVATLRTSGGDAPSAGGGLDLSRTPLAVLVVSGSVLGGAAASVVAQISGETVIAKVSGETVIAKVSGETVVAKVSGETVIAKVSGETVIAKVSGETVLIGQFRPYLTSGEENTALNASGARVEPLVDQKGFQMVRVDRVHLSGGYARYDRAVVVAQGDTVIDTPGSGRALRLKAIQDSYMGNSGAVLVAYRFGAAPAAHFFRHQIGANFPNWGMNLVGAEIQGGVGAELQMNLNVALSSGVEFTIVIEEVGSGAVF